MAISALPSDTSPETVTPLLQNDAVDGAVDYKGRPAYRSSSGGWRSASFIIGVEIAERIAYYGIASNLISYLTGPMGQSTATAAANVNVWNGASQLLPLLGAFVADSFLGRYRTIIVASLLYVLGLGLLTLSAVLLGGAGCQNIDNNSVCSFLNLQVYVFFFSLYLVSVGLAGHKPCVQAFGADQFDGNDPVECKAKSSFFNWWYFCMCSGTLLSVTILNYIEDNLSWALGFGIPCVLMVVALVVFLFGTTSYRYSIRGEVESPFGRISRVFVAAIKNFRAAHPEFGLEEEALGLSVDPSSKQLKFLDKALLVRDGLRECGKVITINEVEEAKSVIRLVPIWASSLLYAVVFAQSTTLFTKQGSTMDRSITTGISIPAASLQSFISLSIILFIPIYDRIFVPIMRAFTGKPSGITMLQRIGTGIFLSVLSMAIAALVEIKRLKIAQEYGLVDKPDVIVPMGVCWLIPQYVLFGISDVFTMVGLQEFFYDQVPKELRSMGLSLYLSIFGVGSLLSSFLVSTIDKVTSKNGHDSWFANNLNRAHLDYFYWLLAGLSIIQLLLYLYCAKSYIYNRANTV